MASTVDSSTLSGIFKDLTNLHAFCTEIGLVDNLPKLQRNPESMERFMREMADMWNRVFEPAVHVLPSILPELDRSQVFRIIDDAFSGQWDETNSAMILGHYENPADLNALISLLVANSRNHAMMLMLFGLADGEKVHTMTEAATHFGISVGRVRTIKREFRIKLRNRVKGESVGQLPMISAANAPTPLQVLGFEERLFNALYKCHFCSVEALEAVTDDTLLSHTHIGGLQLDLIRESIAAYRASQPKAD